MLVLSHSCFVSLLTSDILVVSKSGRSVAGGKMLRSGSTDSTFPIWQLEATGCGVAADESTFLIR